MPVQAMVATLPHDLRGVRNRAILLLGYAGGLRRSEIVSLDMHKDDTPGSGGWREVEIGRGSSDQTCPIHALERWLHVSRIDVGPVFVRCSRDGKRVLKKKCTPRT